MPKNKRGGKGYKKGKKGADASITRAILYREPGQYYAKVTKMTGNRNLMAIVEYDNPKKTDELQHKEVICHIRGSMRKRTWINRDDLILVSERDYEPDKFDVLHKYNNDEMKSLEKQGEIKSKSLTTSGSAGDDNIHFCFTDSEDDSYDESSVEASALSNSVISDEGSSKNEISIDDNVDDGSVNIDNL